MSPLALDGIESAERFVRRNFADNPVAARAYVAASLARAEDRTATAVTDDQRSLAAAFTRAANAAANTLAELEGATP